MLQINGQEILQIMMQHVMEHKEIVKILAWPLWQIILILQISMGISKFLRQHYLAYTELLPICIDTQKIMKIISWGLTDLPANQHQFLDDTKHFISSKNWYWLVGKSVKPHYMIFIFIKTHSMSILLKKFIVSLLGKLYLLWIHIVNNCDS